MVLSSLPLCSTMGCDPIVIVLKQLDLPCLASGLNGWGLRLGSPRVQPLAGDCHTSLPEIAEWHLPPEHSPGRRDKLPGGRALSKTVGLATL